MKVLDDGVGSPELTECVVERLSRMFVSDLPAGTTQVELTLHFVP